MLKLILYLLMPLIFFNSCNSQEPTLAEEKPLVKELTQVPMEVLTPSPEAYFNSIRARANGIEATMYNSGASFSVFDPKSAFAFSSQIALKAPKTTTKNQIGHIMFLENGENILLTGIYDNGTDIFMKIDDKEIGKVYYNILTGKARDLFTNVKVQKAE
jgi:hypothetical protein